MSIMLAARASNWAVMAKDKAGERPGRGVSVKIAERVAQESTQYKISKIKLALSIMAITPTTESTNACVAAW
jgi:hypothetical protein